MGKAAAHLSPTIGVVAADDNDICRQPQIAQAPMETLGLLDLICDLWLDDLPLAFGSTKGKGRHLPALSSMRPTRIELATFGLKDRRSLVPVKGPLTTELRAPCSVTLSA